MKKLLDFVKNRWLNVAVGLGVIIIPSSLLYYTFFFSPKQKVHSFLFSVEEGFKKGKEGTERIENYIGNWNVITEGDPDKTSQDLRKIKADFSTLKEKLDKIQPSAEYEETQKILKQFAEKGVTLSSNLETLLVYFKKVEEVVKSFNNLNTTTQTLEEMTALVMNFKSISEQSLQGLENIEASQVLINIDKDYKDLLRQYIKSSDELMNAINNKDTKRIESVGKESDEAIAAINRQLDEDMKIFRQNSSFSEDLAKIKEFRKTAEEQLANLRASY